MADRVFAVGLMVLVAAFWMETADLPGATGGAAVGPAFVPRVILGTIFGLALLVLVQSVIKSEEAVRFTGIGSFLRLHWRVPALLAAVGVYIGLMGLIGFAPASVIFLLGAFALLIRERSRAIVIAAVIIAVGLPFSLEWLFESALNTFLP